jgi:hypothetical protein
MQHMRGVLGQVFLQSLVGSLEVALDRLLLGSLVLQRKFLLVVLLVILLVALLEGVQASPWAVLGLVRGGPPRESAYHR